MISWLFQDEYKITEQTLVNINQINLNKVLFKVYYPETHVWKKTPHDIIRTITSFWGLRELEVVDVWREYNWALTFTEVNVKFIRYKKRYLIFEYSWLNFKFL